MGLLSTITKIGLAKRLFDALRGGRSSGRAAAPRGRRR